jgi:uncharacterized protein YkwD
MGNRAYARTVGLILLGSVLTLSVIAATTSVGPSLQMQVEDGGAGDSATGGDENDDIAAGSVGDATVTTYDQTAPLEMANVEPKEVEWEVHKRINEVRQTAGLDRVKMLPDLRSAARMHSRSMARRGYYSHVSPEGRTLENRLAAVGFTCTVQTQRPGKTVEVGENIARVSPNHGNETKIAHIVVSQWMEGEGQRQSILEDAYYREGIGVAVTDDRTVYVTQNLC